MKSVRTLLAENKIFFFCLYITIPLSTIFLLLQSKEKSFLLCNPLHNHLLDIFFSGFTNFGDGIFSLIIFFILLFRKKITPASLVLLGYLVSGLVAQIAKNLYHAPRPATLFAAGNYPHFIQGITLVGYSSFPSGHTASAFALATIASLLDPVKQRAVIYLFIAFAIGY